MSKDDNNPLQTAALALEQAATALRSLADTPPEKDVNVFLDREWGARFQALDKVVGELGKRLDNVFAETADLDSKLVSMEEDMGNALDEDDVESCREILRQLAGIDLANLVSRDELPDFDQFVERDEVDLRDFVKTDDLSDYLLEADAVTGYVSKDDFDPSDYVTRSEAKEAIDHIKDIF